MPDKEPRIVAELGRPETPEETAARKAENSRKHRANQTLRNLIYSLIATLAVVLVLVAVVVRPDPDQKGSVDFHQVAADSQVNSTVPLADPQLSDEWSANDATLTTGADGIATWYIGFITPKTDFIALKQGIGANPSWVSQQLTELTPTGATVIDSVTWDVYDHRDAKDPGNFAYALVAETGPDTYVLYGTAADSEFETLATAILKGQK
jgi:hypothetical protein